MATQRPKGASGGHKLARPMARSRPKASDARIRGSDARSSVSAGRPRTSAFPNGGGSFQFPSPTGADLKPNDRPFGMLCPRPPSLRCVSVGSAAPSPPPGLSELLRATRSHYASSTAGRRPQSCMCMTSPHSSPALTPSCSPPPAVAPTRSDSFSWIPFGPEPPTFWPASDGAETHQQGAAGENHTLCPDPATRAASPCQIAMGRKHAPTCCCEHSGGPASPCVAPSASACGRSLMFILPACSNVAGFGQGPARQLQRRPRRRRSLPLASNHHGATRFTVSGRRIFPEHQLSA